MRGGSEGQLVFFVNRDALCKLPHHITIFVLKTERNWWSSDYKYLLSLREATMWNANKGLVSRLRWMDGSTASTTASATKGDG